MNLRLECPNCQFRYSPIPDDDGPAATAGPINWEDYKEKIFKRRYGQDSTGRNIECLICTSCYNISYVFIKVSLSNFMRVSSRYKNEVLIEPKNLRNICTEANRIFDTSDKDIKSILEDDFRIPAKIFNLLSELHLLTLHDLGLKHFGRYCDYMHRSVGAFSPEVLKLSPAGQGIQNIDKLDMQEMYEIYDIYDRKNEIEKNKA